MRCRWRFSRLRQGNVSAFYYLSLAGFFSLVVGTVVMLRRPADRTSLHFYAVCVLFFLMYSISYTGKLSPGDWVLFWADHLATLFLPVVYLHFCLTFPERRLHARRLWIVPALYMPALVVTGASVTGQALLARGEEPATLWGIVETIDRLKPLYFGVLFALAFAVLLRSYRRARSVVARRQVKWLVWGTAAGVFPFLAFYALPFALGREPGLAMQLVGYGPLALIPLSLAYAVVKHRLMDVELMFRRGLGYVLAVAVIVGLALLTVGVTDVLWEEPHATLVALLSALVVVLLFTPVKERIMEALERLSYKERYSSRKALVTLAEDLNADLDLERTSERLLEGIGAALGLREMALFLPGEDGHFGPYRARGVPKDAPERPRLSAPGLVERLCAGQPVEVEAAGSESGELAAYGLAWLLPVPREGRADRRARRRPQGRARAARQRGGLRPEGGRRPGRLRDPQRPALPQPDREGRGAARAEGVQREHPREPRLRHRGPRPRGPHRAVEPRDGGPRRPPPPRRARPDARRGLPERLPRGAARLARRRATTRRSRTSTSCTCPPPTGAA